MQSPSKLPRIIILLPIAAGLAICAGARPARAQISSANGGMTMPDGTIRPGHKN